MLLDQMLTERRVAMGQLSDFGTSALLHPDAVGIYAMWTALRGDRPAPFRAELDAEKIGPRAPFLAILEYVGPSNFRVRIAGDRLNKWFGIELRGMSALSMIEPDARNHFQSMLNRITAEPAVAALRGQARRPDGFSARFEMVLLPMRSDFGRIDRVLVGLWLTDAPAMTQGPLRLDATEFVVTPISDDAPAADPAGQPSTGSVDDDGLAEDAAPFAAAERQDESEDACEAAREDRAARPDIRRPVLRVIRGGADPD